MVLFVYKYVYIHLCIQYVQYLCVYVYIPVGIRAQICSGGGRTKLPDFCYHIKSIK